MQSQDNQWCSEWHKFKLFLYDICIKKIYFACNPVLSWGTARPYLNAEKFSMLVPFHSVPEITENWSDEIRFCASDWQAPGEKSIKNPQNIIIT
jgi:hypothetical protein